MVALLRWAFPPLADFLLASFQFALEPYYPLVLSFFIILQVPLLFGVVFGFLILDEKDDRVLTILQVTPVTLQGYIRYRLLAVVIFSIIYVMAILGATGLIEFSLWVRILPIAAVSGIFAVFSMFLLLAFANNKVEGLAIMKGMGIMMLGPLAAYFIDSKWQLLLGFLPSYWPAKAYWLTSDGQNAWIYVGIGFIYTSFWIVLLWKRFKRKVSM
jgi:fluoroquinolone transport system permease protein